MNSEKDFKKDRQKAKEEPQLIEQFFVTLLATFQQVKVNNPSAAPDIVSRIEELLKITSWQNAYEIERLLIEIYDEKTLDFEVGRRLVEAKRNLSEDAYLHYDGKIKVAQTDEEKRAVLNRLVNDLQWQYAIKESRRTYSRLTSKNTGITFILSIVVFVALIGWIGSKLELFQQNDWYYLVIAIASGLVGATFSMIVSLRDRLTASSFDELKGLYRVVYITTRAIIGLGAALILYFFLQAELLSGSMFPEFKSRELKKQDITQAFDDFVKRELADTTLFNSAAINTQRNLFLGRTEKLLTSNASNVREPLQAEAQKFIAQVKKPNAKVKEGEISSRLSEELWLQADFTPLLDTKNLALLIVWCILAGFSEKFVPNLLAKAEEKATVKSA